MIRPDTLAEGLKITKADTLFSPLALPDIDVQVKKNGKDPSAVVRLKGVAVFDRKNRTTDYKRADSGYISAWYLDEDYDPVHGYKRIAVKVVDVYGNESTIVKEL